MFDALDAFIYESVNIGSVNSTEIYFVEDLFWKLSPAKYLWKIYQKDLLYLTIQKLNLNKNVKDLFTENFIFCLSGVGNKVSTLTLMNHSR